MISYRKSGVYEGLLPDDLRAEALSCEFGNDSSSRIQKTASASQAAPVAGVAVFAVEVDIQVTRTWPVTVAFLRLQYTATSAWNTTGFKL